MIQRRLDHFRNVLRARGEHQRHFRHRRQSLRLRVEQYAPDFLPRRRSSRLAGFNHLVSGGAKRLRQFAHLRALPGSVETFEGNKISRRRNIVGMIAALVRLCTAARSRLLKSKILQRCGIPFVCFIADQGRPYKK